VACPRESRLDLRAQPEPHELGHRRLAQWPEHHDLGRGVGGERRKQRRPVVRFGRPRRSDHGDRQFLNSSPKEVEKAQRGLIRPVRVIDREQQRRAPGEVRAQPVEPMQDRERGVEQRIGGVIMRPGNAEQRRRAPGRAG
jgi:hypothetical protein